MITGKVLGEKYIVNGIPADVSGFTPDMSADIYYEVVRLINRKFLFLDDHLERLKRSLSGSGLIYPDPDVIKGNLKTLQLNNSFTEGNIRICLYKNERSHPDLHCYFIPYFYPEACMYKSGVQLVTFPHVRPNPGIKKWDDHFRSSVSTYIRDHGVYEVILMNTLRQVTEGSRSNIFFLDQHERLFTAPENDILPGITRKYVLRICHEEHMEVIDKPIPYHEMDQMRACFISGTSPKVLPVWKLDGFQFNAGHPLLHLLMDRFETLLEKNLTSLL